MGVYAVTGSASGMGAEVARKLTELGHTVIGVDVHDADVVADLSHPRGRRRAADAVLAAAAGRLDGAVMAAGVGPLPGKDRLPVIPQVNFLGVVDLLTAWRPALAAAGSAKVVVFGSNSTIVTPGVPRAAVRALLAHDATKATRAVMIYGRVAPQMAYAASKLAVSRWVRSQAVTPDWAGEGIRLNVLAPGAVATPLLDQQLASPGSAKTIRSFPVPVSSFGRPDQLADWAVFMLSDAAEFLCGSVVVVDGGSEAYFRGNDWPKPLPLRQIIGFARRYRQFGRVR